MSESKKPKKPGKMSTARRLEIAEELLDEQRVLIKYLHFDVEATRRERDYWRKRYGKA